MRETNAGWRRHAAALVAAGLATIVPAVVHSTAAAASQSNVTFHGGNVVQNIQPSVSMPTRIRSAAR